MQNRARVSCCPMMKHNDVSEEAWVYPTLLICTIGERFLVGGNWQGQIGEKKKNQGIKKLYTFI